MKQLLTIVLTQVILTCFGERAKVIRIIDGDTFETEAGEKVRLIGINAPENSDIFGQEAKQHLANLIDQKTIDLQSDNISDNRDRYSRLLRYAILDGTDINMQMLSDGYATAYLKYPFSKSEDYRQAQLAATKNHIGMWGNNTKCKTPAKQNDKVGTTHILSSKLYFIGGVILFLICFGIYFSFKK